MTVDYAEGDVIEGRFSCSPAYTVRAIVRIRIPDGSRTKAGFSGDRIDYEDGHGYGAWGYDNEIERVRPSTLEDERAAAAVKERVTDDTERMLWRIRRAANTHAGPEDAK